MIGVMSLRNPKTGLIELTGDNIVTGYNYLEFIGAVRNFDQQSD